MRLAMKIGRDLPKGARLLLQAAAFCALAAAAGALAAEDCDPAQTTEFGGAAPARDGQLRRPELNLADPGRYCLRADLHQRKLLDPRTGREMKTVGGDAIVLIGADDVSLDLGGHAIVNERESGYTLVRHYRYEPGRGHFHAFVRSRIRNGSLRSPGSRGIGIRLVSSRSHEPFEGGLAPAWREGAQCQGCNGESGGFGTPVRIPPGKAPADVFPDTGHVLEDLVVEAGSHAILLDGKNNVIRNSRIIAHSDTAIVAQGPGTVIENNRIEVHADAGTSAGRHGARQAQARFAIRLIQADGAVVRNNEVRLVGGSGAAPLPAAIGLVASRDVVVEDNRIEGVQVLAAADADSSYRESRNRLQTCRAGQRRFQPPDETGELTRAGTPTCRSAARR